MGRKLVGLSADLSIQDRVLDRGWTCEKRREEEKKKKKEKEKRRKRKNEYKKIGRK